MPWARSEDGHIAGTSQGITVVIDGTTGGVRTLVNAITGQVLVGWRAPVA